MNNGLNNGTSKKVDLKDLPPETLARLGNKDIQKEKLENAPLTNGVFIEIMRNQLELIKELTIEVIQLRKDLNDRNNQN